MVMRIGGRDDAGERGLAVEGAAAFLDVRDELLAPVLEVARDRIDGEVAQRTERAPENLAANRLEQLDVALLPMTVFDPLQDLHHPARALATRRALAARLVLVELRRAQSELHH